MSQTLSEAKDLGIWSARRNSLDTTLATAARVRSKARGRAELAPNRHSSVRRGASRSIAGGLASVSSVGAIFLRLPQPQRAVRRQPCIADLIRQRAIADGQGARRLLAIPVMLLQYL